MGDRLGIPRAVDFFLFFSFLSFSFHFFSSSFLLFLCLPCCKAQFFFSVHRTENRTVLRRSTFFLIVQRLQSIFKGVFFFLPRTPDPACNCVFAAARRQTTGVSQWPLVKMAANPRVQKFRLCLCACHASATAWRMRISHVHAKSSLLQRWVEQVCSQCRNDDLFRERMALFIPTFYSPRSPSLTQLIDTSICYRVEVSIFTAGQAKSQR